MHAQTLDITHGHALEATTLLTGGVRALEAPETLIERVERPAPRFALLDEMIVERGTKADWDLLHDLH